MSSFSHAQLARLSTAFTDKAELDAALAALTQNTTSANEALRAGLDATSSDVDALEHEVSVLQLVVLDTKVPVGAVMPFASANPPTGWLSCNGALVPIDTFPALYAALGDLYNEPGDPSDSFRVPDLRGEFVRGFDAGRGVDEARTLGSAQVADIAPHEHGLLMTRAALANETVGPSSGLNPASAFAGNVMVSVGADKTSTSLNNTGTETRPRNVALLYCIKT